MKSTALQARKTRGFTVVELMLVVVIMGIMASTAAILSEDSGQYRAELAETQLRDAIDYAKALAHSTRRAHGVVFDVATERLAVVDEDGALAQDPLRKAGYIVDFLAPGQPRNIDLQSASFGAAGNVAIFDPQGIPFSGGTLVVRCHTATLTLTLDASTGVVTST
jgi:prepilin-type N-terminal cleavage/methylation domain-containing protein